MVIKVKTIKFVVMRYLGVTGLLKCARGYFA